MSDHRLKEGILFIHFKNLIGTPMNERKVMNWDLFQHPSADLQHLETQFNEDEIKAAVFYLHDEKAPGPDGFIGKFFKRFWDLIREDLVAAVQQLYCLRGDNWKLHNSSHIVLLLTFTASIHASDYRPVSLLHSFAKILGKLLASRLAVDLPHLFSAALSAFIMR